MSSTDKTYETTAPSTDKVRDRRGLALAISAGVILLDRITKHIVVQQLPNGQTHTVIPGVFRISDVHNTGAAFSMFAETASPDTVRYILIAFSVLAVRRSSPVMLWRVRPRPSRSARRRPLRSNPRRRHPATSTTVSLPGTSSTFIEVHIVPLSLAGLQRRRLLPSSSARAC